ncbi:MAG: imidazole glycerol phosphate synthase subunit HisH [Cocleimonas sp.]
MQNIVVIDYSMGNLHSVHKALQHVTNDKVVITADADEIAKADRIVFPGQGAARDCMSELHKRELVDVVKEVSKTKPFLGVCMGMQVLLEHSVEGGGIDCIGLYKGRVEFFKDHIGAIDTKGNRLKIPQMGWNRISHTQDHPLWNGIEDGSRFYFVHSYFIDPSDKSIIAGETDYGVNYPSAIAKDNIFAIQAHPEKSADDGLQLLKNFTTWDGSAN